MKNKQKKHIDPLKSIDLYNKKYELKQNEDTFPQNLMNNLIRDKLKEIANLQDNIKTDNRRYKSKSTKVYNLNEIGLLFFNPKMAGRINLTGVNLGDQFGRYEEFLCQYWLFLSIFIDFLDILTFPCYKETSDVNL